jgi:hypothetical protein
MTKESGGLGVLNLREHNKALMIKNLFKFYNHQNIPWVNLLWRAYITMKVYPISLGEAEDPFGGEIVYHTFRLSSNLPFVHLTQEILLCSGLTNGLILCYWRVSLSYTLLQRIRILPCSK